MAQFGEKLEFGQLSPRYELESRTQMNRQVRAQAGSPPPGARLMKRNTFVLLFPVLSEPH